MGKYILNATDAFKSAANILGVSDIADQKLIMCYEQIDKVALSGQFVCSVTINLSDAPFEFNNLILQMIINDLKERSYDVRLYKSTGEYILIIGWLIDIKLIFNN